MTALHAVSTPQLRSIALIRVSKVAGRDDLLSPELQRDAIARHAKQRGARVIEWVEALDESAHRSKSPWWARLDQAVEAVERGDADAILVWKVSRAARHRRHWAVALDRVEAAGGVLESATEGFDPRTSTGKLTRGILAELAAWDSDVKSEQWRETHANRRARGLPSHRLKTFGYSWNGEAYVPDADTIDVIKWMYQAYIDGQGFPQILRHLNNEGIRTSAGNLWSLSTVLRWMDSGFAAGLLWVNKKTNPHHEPGAHEPIISTDMWEKYLVKRQQMRYVAPRLRRPKHHLSGLVVCGRCGQTMVSYPLQIRGKKEKIRTFRCRTFTDYSACPGVYIYANVVDQAVKEFFEPLVDDQTKLAEAAAAMRTTVTRSKNEAAKWQRELDSLANRSQKMLERLDAGVISDEDYRTWRSQRDARSEELRQKVISSESQSTAPPVGKHIARLLQDWDKAAAEHPADLSAVLRTLIREIVVSPGASDRVRVVPRWQ